MNRLTLRFQIAGIPIAVDPSFWFMTVLLGLSAGSASGLAVWVACVFVAVLVHELGHASAARLFGGKAEIVLYTMGGVTPHTMPKGVKLGRAASMFISFAGPLAGFMLAAGAVMAALVFMPEGGGPSDRVQSVLHLLSSGDGPALPRKILGIMLWINVIWGAVNLLPVLPLDGGNLARSMLSGSSPQNGLVRALWLSAVVAPCVALLAFRLGLQWAAMMFAYFSYTAVKQLIEARRVAEDVRQGLETRLDDARNAIDQEDFSRAEEQAKIALNLARSPVVRATAAHLLAVALLRRGQPGRALEALLALPETSTDPTLLGACLLSANRPADAIPHLERAAASGNNPAATELLQRARERTGQNGPRSDDDPSPDER